MAWHEDGKISNITWHKSISTPKARESNPSVVTAATQPGAMFVIKTFSRSGLNVRIVRIPIVAKVVFKTTSGCIILVIDFELFAAKVRRGLSARIMRYWIGRLLSHMRGLCRLNGPYLHLNMS